MTAPCPSLPLASAPSASFGPKSLRDETFSLVSQGFMSVRARRQGEGPGGVPPARGAFRAPGARALAKLKPCFEHESGWDPGQGSEPLQERPFKRVSSRDRSVSRKTFHALAAFSGPKLSGARNFRGSEKNLCVSGVREKKIETREKKFETREKKLRRKLRQKIEAKKKLRQKRWRQKRRRKKFDGQFRQASECGNLRRADISVSRGAR